MSPRLRLDRALANLGYGSRTEVKVMIGQHRVRVRGDIATNPGLLVDAVDVTIDGEPLDHPGTLLVMLHKPLGYVCSHDEREGPRAYDLLPARWLQRNPRIEAVGRLDKDSTGLLLLTDDHALLHRMTSPKHHVPKRYLVTLDAPADGDVVARFASGTLLIDGDDTPCRPAQLTLLDDADGSLSAEVVLTEGRFRQVRRMFAACGRTVVTLHRTHIGDHALGDLPVGSHAVLAPTA